MVVISLARLMAGDVQRVAPMRVEVGAAEPLVFSIDGSGRARPSRIRARIDMPIQGLVTKRRTFQGFSDADRLEFAVTGLEPGEYDVSFSAGLGDDQPLEGRLLLVAQ